MHQRSALPYLQKVHVIRNEKRRIANRCTEKNENFKEQSNFNKILHRNGYQGEDIERMNSTTKRSRELTQKNQKYFYLNIPFISDTLDFKILKELKRTGLPIRIAHTYWTLRRALAGNINCKNN